MRLIQRDDLRHVGDRVAGKARLSLGDEDVARCVEKPSVRRQDDAEDGLEPTSIERIRLDDENGASEAGLRST